MEFILNELDLTGPTRILTAVIILIFLTILVSWVATLVLKGVASRPVRQTRSDLDDRLHAAAKRYLRS